jgi:hypothetical protein
MTSLIRNYAQRDNRLESVELTGFVRDNGIKAGTPGQQKPAYAAIDLTRSKNFSIDTRVLIKRSDSSGPFLVRAYISSSKPPSYYQNLEFDIFVIPPTVESPLLVEIYSNRSTAENAQVTGGNPLISVTNEIPPASGDFSDKTGIITCKVINNSIVLKNVSPNFSS